MERVYEGHELAATLALWMACQTLFDVNGTSREVTPRGTSASITALAIAAGAATVPASPAPFTPRMLSGLGVSVRVSSKGGSSLARGTAYSIRVALSTRPLTS